jgi:micrococcal nuclease
MYLRFFVLTYIYVTIKTMSSFVFDDINDAPFLSLNGLECDAKITSCYDGDTVHAIIPLHGTMYKWKCRLSNIDTPEIKSRDENEKRNAILARNKLSEMILNKVVRVKCGVFEKYGRLLIEIYIPLDNDSDEICVNEWMISNGYAHRYNGGTKGKWV